jgi:cell fate regulator YaaT (PSP1 superfamily)
MTENNNIIETPEEQDTSGQTTVSGIRFKSCGRIYNFDANNLDLKPGAQVVVDSEMGLSLAHVVSPGKVVEKGREPFKKVLRLANEKDFETVSKNRLLEEEARAFCMERAKDLNLSMKVVKTDTTLDKKRIVFYFTADGRIDFRELVRDLAAKFKTRIEMRQIGVRDEVKLLGGIGACGRQTCCRMFLTSFEPITIRMAKQQDLSINQSKLSGICGRLMCCLGYEVKGAAEADSAFAEENAEDFVTITDDTVSSGLLPAESDGISSQLLKDNQVSPGLPDTVKTGTEKGTGGKAEETADTHSKGKKPRGRNRRRRGRRRPGKTAPASGDKAAQDKAPATAESPKQPGTREKGRPFNKRKRFWKKKKKEEKPKSGQ